MKIRYRKIAQRVVRNCRGAARNFAILSFLLLLCSSCFEITEEVSMNEDGSGKFRLTINLSESRQSLVNYMKLEEVEGVKVPRREEMDEKLDLVRQALSRMEGLSEVEVKRNFEQFIFSFSGNFSETEVLNKAINEVIGMLSQSTHTIIEEQNFHHSEQHFARYFKYPIPAEAYDNASISLRYMMDTARLISVFRFSKPVKKSSNQHTLISPSRKSLMLQATIAELVKGEIVLDNKISF